MTSNFTINDVVEHSTETNGNTRGTNKFALLRRFWHIHCNELLHLLGVKLLPAYEVSQLKKQGNTDPGKIFMTWDYVNDCPLGMPLRSPEEYRKILKDTYYSEYA